MAWTYYNFPAAFAAEGDPKAQGGFPGDTNPYIHTANDSMQVDDETGYFSIDVSFASSSICIISIADWQQHMAKFTELAIAFVVEQAGWDNTWR